MAEYTSLGDFFGAVANAIRSKKGTTDKIVPINFPEEIASIEVGGSGGGSGVYYEVATLFNHNVGMKRLFTFKGESYLYEMSGSKAYIYKYENGITTKVVELATSTLGAMFCSGDYWLTNIVEYKDKIYFGCYKTIATWDGTTFEKLTVPSTFTSIESSSVLIKYNDALYLFHSKNTFELYKLNESNNTFELEKTITAPSNYMTVFEFYDGIYCITSVSGKYYLYKFNGNGFDKVSDIEMDEYCVSVGNVIYCGSLTLESRKLYKYDIEKNEYIELGYKPYATLVGELDGKVHFHDYNNKKVHYILHEV